MICIYSIDKMYRALEMKVQGDFGNPGPRESSLRHYESDTRLY
jgi:hypothetical protein